MTVSSYYDLLPTATADYETTILTVPCTNIGNERSGKGVILHQSEDNTISAIVLSSVPTVTVQVDFVNISSTNQATLFDFFHDSGKGNSGGRTIKWTYPKDNKTYVARMIGPLVRDRHQSGNYYTYKNVTFQLEGKYA